MIEDETEPKPPNVVRVAHIAEAYEHVARINHYLVGVIVTQGPITTPELEAAEQLLIDKQNAGPQKGQRYVVLDRALDLIEHELRTVRRNG